MSFVNTPLQADGVISYLQFWSKELKPFRMNESLLWKNRLTTRVEMYWKKISSTCFVLACKTGLDTGEMAEILSQKIAGHKGRKIRISFNKTLSQGISTAVWARALYSTSVDDWTSVPCFLAHQVTGEAPRKTQKPVVEHQYVGIPAQSASEYIVSLRLPLWRWLP